MAAIVLLCMIGLVQSASLSQNKSLFEDSCKTCILDKTNVFLKVITFPSSQIDYVCQSIFNNKLKTQIIVDRACKIEQSLHISNFSFKPIVNFTEGICDEEITLHERTSHEKTHEQILNIIRDYTEILFMGIILSLMFIKKVMLDKCLFKNNNLIDKTPSIELI